MANQSITDEAWRRNTPANKNLEVKHNLLLQLKSLLEVVLNSNLQAHSLASLHGYLWVLSDLVEKLLLLNEA